MKIVICVEGDSDIKFIKDFVDYNKFEISSNDISYIKSGGKDKLSLSKQNLITWLNKRFIFFVVYFTLGVTTTRSLPSS